MSKPVTLAWQWLQLLKIWGEWEAFPASRPLLTHPSFLKCLSSSLPLLKIKMALFSMKCSLLPPYKVILRFLPPPHHAKCLFPVTGSSVQVYALSLPESLLYLQSDQPGKPGHLVIRHSRTISEWVSDRILCRQELPLSTQYDTGASPTSLKVVIHIFHWKGLSWVPFRKLCRQIKSSLRHWTFHIPHLHGDELRAALCCPLSHHLWVVVQPHFSET